MWYNLFYDKYAGDINGCGDHHYNNEITKLISITDLEDGSYNYYVGKAALDVCNKKFTGGFALPESIHGSNLFKLMLYQKNTNSIETIYVVVGININKLEKIVAGKQEIPYIDFIKQLCRYHTAYTETAKFVNNNYFYNSNSLAQKIGKNTEYIVENVMKPIDYTFDNRIDNLKEINVILYEYQKCSVHWMKQKESNKTVIRYNLNEEVILGCVYYDIITQKFDLITNKTSLTFNGGAIIDEVGLGKTLQVIALAIVNPPSSFSYKRNDVVNKFVSKATLVFCPNQLCGQWIRELRDKINDDYELKIVSLMTKRDFDKVTYNDLLDADFVVVSFTFLGNQCFTFPWTSRVSTSKSFHKQIWKSADIQLITKLFNELGSELVKDPINSLYKINPLIQLIHWHRIVIDEFHEVYKDTTYSYIDNLLPFLTGDNKWCVTATPFNQRECLYSIVNYLTNYKNLDGTKIYNVEQIIDYLNDNSFRRNTKDSVKQEHTLPPIKEQIRWLKFSPTERMIYNAYLADPNNDKFSVYLRQLCCHPQLADETKEALSNCKTLNDIEKMMTHHYKLQMDDAQEKVDEIQTKINKANKKLVKSERKLKKRFLKKLGVRMAQPEKIDDPTGVESDSDSESSSSDDDLTLKLIGTNDIDKLLVHMKSTITIDNLKIRLRELDYMIKEAKNILDGKTKTYNFFNNVVEKIRKTVNKESNDSNKMTKTDLALESDANLMNIMTTQFKNKDTSTVENDDEMCGICLDDIPEDDIGVTVCGHMFCFECLKMAISKNHSCPYCKKKLSDKEIYVLSYERKKKNEKESVEDKNKIELINEIGTKLANLITYLRESNEHTIIFSQWDDLLRRVGRILKDNNILNVFCKGNCYQRDKAIREFNSDDKIKIIMLSSDSTAAGTNLTKASQVIFIDPIYGTYDYRKGQEKQAIGRAHRLGQKANIKVIRFIIKDSVEEEIYKINLIEDKKHISEFESTNEIVIA